MSYVIEAKQMMTKIFEELKIHAPFTVFGAVTGIVIMYFFHKLQFNTAYNIFYILHPIHVLLSALVTSSMYNFYRYGKMKTKRDLIVLLVIGYIGSIGIATISDSVIPYLGEILLNLPNRSIHIGFIEKWWLINPLAVIGVMIAYIRPSTKLPHFGHVLLSTWASIFHIIMAISREISFLTVVFIFIFLFIAVWIPCCVSDIVFPLLFVGSDKKFD